jgi:heat-inducible transcriptional repressor
MTQLTERQSEILRLTVEQYIDSSQPVGSHEIVGKLGAKISPATVRSEMKELEDLGFLHQPHTSAGRVPTDIGYRFFVDWLVNQDESTHLQMADKMASKLQAVCQAHSNLIEATKLLSEATGHLSMFGNSEQMAVRGHHHLAEMPEFDQIANEMMGVLDEPRSFMQMFHDKMRRHQVMTFIGEGNCHNLSWVVGRFGDKGMIGIVGPKRMNYREIIPSIELIVNLLDEE